MNSLVRNYSYFDHYTSDNCCDQVVTPEPRALALVRSSAANNIKVLN
nr:MAG TPA: hypothetical protein [Bacteriophage sp.]